MSQAPPAYEKAKSDAGRDKARVKWATEKYAAQTGQRRFTRTHSNAVAQNLKGAAGFGERLRLPHLRQ